MNAIAHKPTKVLITGASGTGKTTFALSYLLGSIRHRSIIVYDWQSEIAGRLNLPAVPLDAGAVFDALSEFRIVCIDPQHTETRAAEGLREVCLLARTWAKEQDTPTLLAVDELHRLQNTGATGLPDEYIDVLEFGRRDRLDLVIVSQAPNLLHNRVKNQLTELVAFRLVDKRAAEWLTPFGLDYETQLTLERGQFRYCNIETGENRMGRVF
jgi:hypothetical protein